MERFKGTAYTAEQANALIAALGGSVLKPVVILGVFFGLRRSEAIGPRWSDIDFDKGFFEVRNTMTMMKTLYETENAKSKASNRAL